MDLTGHHIRHVDNGYGAFEKHKKGKCAQSKPQDLKNSARICYVCRTIFIPPLGRGCAGVIILNGKEQHVCVKSVVEIGRRVRVVYQITGEDQEVEIVVPIGDLKKQKKEGHFYLAL